MVAETLFETEVSVAVFPSAEIIRRLDAELQAIADDGSVFRPEWEPMLDSLQVVGVVIILEDLFPFRIPPDKVVRKGGYNSVKEAVGDIRERLSEIWNDHNNKRAIK